MNNSDIEVLVKGNTTFALDLYGRLKEAEGNLFFSPYSISTALAMTYAGARGNTEAQMSRTLHFTLGQKRLHPAFAALDGKLSAVQERGNIQLRVANALWPQQGYTFLDDYLALMKEYYGVLITSLDYGDAETARGIINAWVEEKTEEKIKDLIGAGVLNAMTRLVLTNAIYFKGNWASQFDKAVTERAPFWVTPDETVKVPMMAQKHEFGYAESDEWQMIDLPYVGDELAMILLLPRQVDGLAELESSLTADALREWTTRLWRREVRVFLPRFKLECKLELAGKLVSMDMADAFNDDKADFSGMDGSKWLCISNVIHQAFVDVNEEGTEAAAATAVVMALKAAPPPPAVFRADHPFVFLIRENMTGRILFIGRVTNPSA